MGFEPTTPTLARLCSTPELHPLKNLNYFSSKRYLYGVGFSELQQKNNVSLDLFFVVLKIRIKIDFKSA